MKNLILIGFLLIGTLAFAQSDVSPENFDPVEFLTEGKPQPKVLLVGTFHFDYPNLDDHKISKEDQVNVQSDEKQAEMRELLDYIARFKPTKIVVERRTGSTVNEQYRNYLNSDNFELRRDEIHQIAFRLGKQFGVDSLVLGDAFNLQNSMWWNADSTVFRPFVDSLWNIHNEAEDTPLDQRYFELYKMEDQVDKERSLLEIFQYLNSVERTRLGHGHYLEFNSDAQADLLAMWWYSRNLRIYRNIQKATDGPEDRILVLFGAGHLGILRQQFESSPAYELVDFDSL